MDSVSLDQVVCRLSARTNPAFADEELHRAVRSYVSLQDRREETGQPPLTTAEYVERAIYELRCSSQPDADHIDIHFVE